MNITKLPAVLLGVLCFTATGLASQSDLGPVLSTLEGRWEGESELLNRPATCP